MGWVRWQTWKCAAQIHLQEKTCCPTRRNVSSWDSSVSQWRSYSLEMTPTNEQSCCTGAWLFPPYRNTLKGQSCLSSVQFSSVAQSCPTLCDPMNHSMLGLPVHHQVLEFTQTQVHRVSDAMQPSHPLSPPSPPAPNRSQHQSLFQWVSSSHEVAKVLEFQL